MARALAGMGALLVPPVVLWFLPIASPNVRMHLVFWTPPVLALFVAQILSPAGKRNSMAVSQKWSLAALMAMLVPLVAFGPVGYAMGTASFTYGNHLQIFNRLAVLTALLLPLAAVLMSLGTARLVYRMLPAVLEPRMGHVVSQFLPPFLAMFAFLPFLKTPFQFGDWYLVGAFCCWVLALEAACLALYRRSRSVAWPGILRALALYVNVYILGDSSMDVYPAAMYTSSSGAFYGLMAVCGVGTVLLATLHAFLIPSRPRERSACDA